MPNGSVVSGVVEGPTDRAALARLVRHAGLEPGTLYEAGGKHALLKRVGAYNNAARFSPWVLLVDLDTDADCAPPFLAEVLPQPAPQMVFRVAVHALESWILADAVSISKFLAVPTARVPRNPDAAADPKRSLVDLAGRSRKKAIRQDIVPRPGSGRPVGPAYASRLVEFIDNHWDIEAAATRSDSLARCVAQLRTIQQRAV